MKDVDGCVPEKLEKRAVSFLSYGCRKKDVQFVDYPRASDRFDEQ